MKKRNSIMLLVLSALVSSTVWVQPASAVTTETTPTAPQYIYTVSVKSTPTDSNFVPVGPTTTVVSNSPSGIVSAEAYTGGSPTPTGCRRVHVWITARTLLGFTAYRWNQWLSWCWGYATVVNQRVAQGMTHNDGAHQYTGPASQGWASWWYAYFTGVQHSGFYARRNATITNCVWILCGGTSYPWTWIRAHGNGTFRYNWGWY